MFNFFKKKETKYSVHAVANGTTVALKDVPDPTFAEEMIGKGVAIIPTDGCCSSKRYSLNGISNKSCRWIG